MPHHAIGLLSRTTTVRPGSPFYVQGEMLATGAAVKNQSNVEYEICGTLVNTAGAASATVIIHNSDRLAIVSTSTTTVTLLEGRDFTGMTGSVWISGTQYTISSVDSATQITLTGSAGTQVSALLATNAPVGTLPFATPGTQALSDNIKSVGKCYTRFLGVACTAIAGTGSYVEVYCRVF